MGSSPKNIAAKDLTMARKSIAERIAQLDAQKKALQARAGKQDRANDTRRKVLLGALVLHRLENAGDAEFSKRLGDWLRRELPGILSRESDRALFADVLASSHARKPSGSAEGSALPASMGGAPKSAGSDVGGQTISATTEKPAQQIGKTMAEVMRYSEDDA
jgi:hypothetical protein